MLAGGPLAGTPLSGTSGAFWSPSYTADIVPPADLYIPSPLLVFFEVEASNGDKQRLVDFADPEASATPGYVDFDGQSWRSISIGAPRVEESLEGRAPVFSVSIADPTREVLSWVSAHDKLRGAEVTIRIISWANLGSPVLSTDRTYRVKQAQSLEGPARISVQFGAPSLHDLSSPHVPFNRFTCINSWPKRFDHLYQWQFCDYPSDNFEVQTSQSLEDAVDTPVAKLHGWSAMNAARPGYFKIGANPATPRLTISDTFTGADVSIWNNGNRKGAFAYKTIPGASLDSDDDFDVHSLVNVIGTKGMIGILVQDLTNQSTWLFWCYRAHSGTYQLLSRKTVADVSTDTTYAITGGPRALRIARTGTSFAVYDQSASLVKTPITSGWTLRTTETITMSGNLRVGIAMSASAAEAQTNDAESLYLRFAKGGYNTCLRRASDCSLRGKTIRRNAFTALPDAIPDF